MNRMRRLNKEKIRATISGLALMIAIGAAGGIGSYAWFSDQAEAKNDLVVTMGNLDVEFDKKNINTSITKDNYSKNEFKQTFEIVNSGSLKQNVKFRFSDISVKDQNVDNKVLSNFKYELSMKHNEQKVVLENGKNTGTLLSLKSMEFTNLKYGVGDKELVELGKDEVIECTLVIKLNDTSNSTLKAVQGNNIEFKTEVESVQLGGTN